MTDDKPFISLDKTSNAPLLSYSIPDSTSYAGRFYTALDTPSDWFEEPTISPPSSGTVVEPQVDPSVSVTSIIEELLPSTSGTGIVLGSATFGDSADESGADVVTGEARLQLSETISRELANGNEPIVLETLFGEKKLAFTPQVQRRTGQFSIVESYQLSTFLGDYGAGRTLNTFSLLPGEKTKITMRSYTKSKTLSKEASSVFDSFTKESADAFEDTVKSEQSRKRQAQESLGWHVEAKASVSFFGAASASVGAGAKGQTASKRQEMAKNIGSATKKHASKASAKRSVQVNTSSEEELEQGSETAIERVLENVNLNRTLNFVFRQMNQEFITILHLVDMRIAYNEGTRGSYEEVSVAELDELVEAHVVASKRAEAKAAILAEIEYVIDYEDNYRKVVHERTVPPEPTGVPDHVYHAFDRSIEDTYVATGNTPQSAGLSIQVPGVIVNVQTNTIRTDGVIVEALLGQSDALDSYALGLQEAAVAAKQAEAELAAAKRDDALHRIEIVNAADAERARLYRKVTFQDLGSDETD